MSLALNDLMLKIAQSMDGVGGCYTYAYPPDAAQPPFAYVNMPESIQYDLTYGRGASRTTIEVHVGVTRNMDAQSALAIGLLASDTGPNSLKVAIEGAELGAQVRVISATFAQIALADGTYAGLVLTLDVAA